MFKTYWRNEERYDSRFQNGWYITGDKARMDEDGYFWFVGRADDVINTAGHLVGPFEVESALIEHPAVAEAGVIGKARPHRHGGCKSLRLPQGRLPAVRLPPPRADALCTAEAFSRASLPGRSTS